MRLFLRATAISFILYSTAASAEALSAGNYEKYTCPMNTFSVLVPKYWEKKERDHPYGDLTKISGVRLTGPKNKDGAAVALSILYYSGEGFFRTPGEFIRSRLNSLVREDPEVQTAVTDTTLAGRPGKGFQIKTFELIYRPQPGSPPMGEGKMYEIAPPYVKVTMIQKFIVIPAREGFYALNYGAPEEIAGEYEAVFEKAARSFEPNLQAKK